MQVRFNTIDCALLMLKDMPPLIVPFATIAEVASSNDRRDFREQTEDMENWLVGYVEWRGVNVPLISFETACGFSIKAVDEYDGMELMHLVILYGVSGSSTFKYLGLLVQGIPRILRLQKEAIQSGERAEDCLFVQARVTVKSSDKDREKIEVYAIPDIEKLERSVASQLRWIKSANDWQMDFY